MLSHGISLLTLAEEGQYLYPLEGTVIIHFVGCSFIIEVDVSLYFCMQAVMLLIHV